MYALRDFGARVSAPTSHEHRLSRSQQVNAYLAAKRERRELLKRLKRLQRWNTFSIWSKVYDWASHGFRKPVTPHLGGLVDLVYWFFPPRMSLKVQVCDIGVGRTNRFETVLGDIESCRWFVVAALRLLTTCRLENKTLVGYS